MIALRVLGGLDLHDNDGRELTSVVVQPKRAAFLVHLAVARPLGFHRRDTLVGLFWPEQDQEHARASLRKTVHHLRRSLGDGVLVGRGDEELALDPDRLTCDAVRFDAALSAGDPQRAIELYRGAFLDGFFLRDASGFEQWQERERARLHEGAFRAAWSLAERGERNGDAFDAAHWARHALSLQPDNEVALRRAIALLDTLGDRAGALAAYNEFAARMAREYELEPAPETRALLNAMRAAPTVVVERAPSPIAPVGDTVLSTTVAPASSADAAMRRWLRRRRQFAAASITVFIVLAGFAGRSVWRGSQPADVSPRTVAVMPFAFRGSPEFDYLAEGIARLLSTSLDQAGDIGAVAEGAVLNLIDERDATQLDVDAGASVAARLGAGMFVMGEIVEVGGRLRLSATLHDVRSPARRIARADAEGASDSLFALMDELATELVAGDRRAPAERLTRLAALTTHSMPALKSYLNGEQLFRAGRYNEAVEAFQAAVAADSTFALGYYRLALAHMWGSQDSDRLAAERAVRHGTRLSGPDRALLDALLPFFRGQAAEAERQYRDILVRRPEESEVWYPLGEVLFHHNPMRGRRAGEAKTAFERSLAFGPKDGPLTHLVEIAAIERDYVAFDSLFTGIEPASHFYYTGNLVQAFVRGDDDARARELAMLRDSSDARLVTAGRHALFLLEDHASVATVLHLLTEPARPDVVRSWGHVHLAHLEVGAGRLEDARAALRDAAAFDADRALQQEAWLYSLPFVAQSNDDVAALRARVAAWVPAHPDTTARPDLVLDGDRDSDAHVRLYLLGLLDAQLGDDRSAMRYADALVALGGAATTRDLAADLAHAVRAEVHRLRGRHVEALAELEQARMEFDANRLNIAPFYAQVRERFVRAELLVQLGRDEEALGWLGSFDEHGPWSRAVLAPAALHQARIYERLDRSEDAARQYARFVGLWQDAEPYFSQQVVGAQQRLAALRSNAAR